MLRRFLEVDLSLPQDKVHKLADYFAKEGVKVINELRRLFLVEDIVDSIKVRCLRNIITGYFMDLFSFKFDVIS